MALGCVLKGDPQALGFTSCLLMSMFFFQRIFGRSPYLSYTPSPFSAPRIQSRHEKRPRSRREKVLQAGRRGLRVHRRGSRPTTARRRCAATVKDCDESPSELKSRCFQERLRDLIGPHSGTYGMGYKAVQPLLVCRGDQLRLVSFSGRGGLRRRSEGHSVHRSEQHIRSISTGCCFKPFTVM